MKVEFGDVSEYRDFLGGNFDDNRGYNASRERRFDLGVQALSDMGDDLALDLDNKWFADEELEDLDLIRH